jgi:hypothetical protein
LGGAGTIIMIRFFALWGLAILIAGTSIIYQKLTGPTHPKRGTVQVGDTSVSYKLIRSHGGEGDAPVRIEVEDKTITGTYTFRRYKSHDEWVTRPLERDGDNLVAWIPHQPPAGKVDYRIELRKGAGAPVAVTEEPVRMRFKGAVPDSILRPHVYSMILVMLLSARAGLEALTLGRRIFRYAAAAFFFLVVGGLILGPFVQKYAFGAYWTGWPFGHDLTDNKVAVAAVFWLVAVLAARRKGKGRGWVLAASVVSLVIWIIPHSVMGSELDFREMEPGSTAAQPAVDA